METNTTNSIGSKLATGATTGAATEPRFCAALGCREELRVGAKKPFCRAHWRMVPHWLQSDILFYGDEASRAYWENIKLALVTVADLEGVAISQYSLHVKKLEDGREVLIHYQDFQGFPCEGIFHVHEGGYEKIAESELVGRIVQTEHFGPVPAPMAAAALMPLREAMIDALQAHAEMKVLEFNSGGIAFWPSLREWSELVVNSALKELMKKDAKGTTS